MEKPFLTLVLAASAFALVSCNQQPDNSAQVKTLEDRIRQLEDQEKQLQLQTQQDKLAADRAALEAEKQRLREQQNAIEQATNKPDPASLSSSSGAATRSADYQNDSKVTQRRDTNSYNLFYDRLQPEGRWFEDDTYGYVWQPGVAERDDNWRPYTDGHWAYTDRGWTWISNEDFGWATYHYGRWTRVRGVGWIWVPGHTWAPAWVSWRQTDHDDYVGWAPLPPECDPTPSVKVEAWVDNYYDIGPSAYVFLRAGDLVRPSYREAILSPQQSVTIIAQTRNVTNITYNNNVVNSFGPQYQQLAQATSNRLEHYQINYQQQTQPNAYFKTVVAGNQLQVVAPPPQLQPRATIQPQTVRQIQHGQVERGWQNIDPAKTQQIKQAFQQTAPPIPKALPPRPAAPPKPIIVAAPNQKPGQPPAALQQLQKAGTPLNDNQIAAERAKIEAEKAQLEQQRQALLTGQKTATAPQGHKPDQPNQPLQAEQPQKEQAPKQQQQAEAEKAKQFEAQKAQQAAQARLQQEAQQKLQAEQQQKELALKQQQQQQAEAEKAGQLEAQKAQQAAQARPQQDVQQKLQAEQQQKELALEQQQQAEAAKASQLEAQKAQQAAQARLQQEAQLKLQAEQQQKEIALKQQQQRAEAEKSKQPEKKVQEEKKKKEEKAPSPGQSQQ